MSLPSVICWSIVSWGRTSCMTWLLRYLVPRFIFFSLSSSVYRDVTSQVRRLLTRWTEDLNTESPGQLITEDDFVVVVFVGRLVHQWNSWQFCLEFNSNNVLISVRIHRAHEVTTIFPMIGVVGHIGFQRTRRQSRSKRLVNSHRTKNNLSLNN